MTKDVPLRGRCTATLVGVSLFCDRLKFTGCGEVLGPPFGTLAATAAGRARVATGR
jgi:hypothetical protein